MTTQEILEPGAQSLRELADEASREHGLVIEAGASMIDHAIRAGAALSELRSRVPPGTWMQWATENLSFSYGTAKLYMRCHEHQAVVRATGWTRITEVKTGLGQLVSANHRAKGNNGRGKPGWMKDLARAMHSEDNAPYAVIARELGVHQATVRGWVDPEYEAESRRKVAAINKRRIAAARALREQERQKVIKQAVRKAGAATAEAWAMAERMQDVLAQAHRETEDAEARKALSQAGVHYRQMRDQIVKALGIA